MQTSSRNHDLGGGYAGKRGHVPQLSISDENHHITEAIGDMYGDHHYGNHDSRPLSFVNSTGPNAFQNSPSARAEPQLSLRSQNRLTRTESAERLTPHVNGHSATMPSRTNSVERENGALSPASSIRQRSNSDTANSRFPLNDLDYESDPAAVAQELSNLQALRRMSMDVNAAGDPDLPAFNSNFGIPNAAPTGSADEDDRARLFWVPARIHPELAPTEFKTFLDSRVNSIKRRSEDRSLSPDSLQREGSGGGLRRKKSMLSRQIDNSGGKGADGYTDGAERLDRKRSLSGADTLSPGISNLQDLEALVSDPEQGRQRLSIDTGSSAGTAEPVLATGPTGGALRRSTRTAYGRGSIRKGERVPFPKRGAKTTTTDGEESPISLPVGPSREVFGLTRVQTEPLPTTERVTGNFSRPGRPARAVAPKPAVGEPHHETRNPPPASASREKPSMTPAPKHFVSQIASNGRKLESPFAQAKVVPHIIETPPSDEASARLKQGPLPERISSHDPPPPLSPQGSLPVGSSSARGLIRSAQGRQNEKTNQTLKDMAAHPSPLPGNSTRTDSLSFIPTLTEDKKTDGKKSKEKKDKEGIDGPRKSSWSWGALLGNEEKEKEKEKKREDDTKKVRSKLGKPPEKSHDNTRLDLLQTTMEGSRGRESLVLDRGDLKLEEERKKESSRKSSGSDGKREKDPGLFSTLFGGKKKNEREAIGKKQVSRNLSPDPPQRLLKPDIDYNWTRFSILEERAIYRMAHIKLANPRRALHSQVLLSNFMYSYLAKVQQMHPQIQIPQSAAQKQQQRKADQPEEFYQYQKYQEQQQKQQQQEEDQVQAESHQQEPVNHSESVHFEYGHGEPDQRSRPQSRASQHETHIMENGSGQHHHGGGGYHVRAQHQKLNHPPHSSTFPYQPTQFDDPERATDEMW
ncbi:hypothetical protein MMC22_002610 [Lobaria immixta]|nr:hypothetical protein [Lobaria immixta]